LTTAQKQILKDVSKYQDSILEGHQSNALSFQHAMSEPGQSGVDARTAYEDFVKRNEDQATRTQINFWAAGNSGLSNRALAQFAAALHAVLDSTSPAHAGFQVWDWRNPVLVSSHHFAENSLTTPQLNTAVSAAQNAFSSTFSPTFSQLDLLHLVLEPVRPSEVKTKICYDTGESQKVCQ